MQAGTTRAKRQPAWHILASEFSEATLNEKGSGEYDPSFVITKLGAKVFAVGINPDGLNINYKCGSTYPEVIKKFVKKQKFHLYTFI